MSIELSLRHVLGDFTLDVAFQRAGAGVTALFGASGAGKTSIVHAIAGLVRPREGRVVIGGRVLFDSAAGIDLPVEARRVGLVFQDARLFPHLTVEGNLRFGWRRAPARVSEAEVTHIVEMLDLQPLLQRRPARLSGGEKSRVALGRALLAAPELLLLDEPLAALDAARKADILPYLERLRDEALVPVLYVSHAVDEVLRLADSVVLLKDGHVAGEGSVFDFASGEIGDMQIASGAVIEAAVLAPRADGLSALGFDGGELLVPKLEAAAGRRLRVRIRAEDILLALEPPRAISANNVLAANITGIRPCGAGQCDVHLACGAAKLVARITAASVARLGLAEGHCVYAVVKSVILDPHALRGAEPG